MRLSKAVVVLLALLLCLTAAGALGEGATPVTEILLSDGQVLVNGVPAGTDPAAAVYTANNIVYYPSGKDFTYGEGTEKDTHEPADAAMHTVVYITQPGSYRLSGQLNRGQIAIDLGERAIADPAAAVTLILNGVDITCHVAPAVIFYNVYECAPSEATKDVDTSAAGANVILADGTVNNITGSYVACIYAPDTVVLTADGQAVEKAENLHEYDGAFYSRMSMNISGKTGVLNLASNGEGISTEMHLTINGGEINITAGNDGINTNQDNLSVTTINGGNVNIRVAGDSGEGDGIDSNGWIVVNGGTVTAAACANSADSGIDADMGIHINGGTVLATGNMLDRIDDGGQTYVALSFAQPAGSFTLKHEDGSTLAEFRPENAYTVLVYSSPSLAPGSYTLWQDETQLAGQAGGMGGGPGMPGMFGMDGMPQMPPEGWENPTPPDGFLQPGGHEPPEKPDWPEDPGRTPDGPRGARGNAMPAADRSATFTLVEGANNFSNISPVD